MSTRDLVVIGGSAGSIEGLTHLVQRLPADLPAAVLCVLHVPAQFPSSLPRVLNRTGILPALHATEGESLRRGRIYIAPPDHHMLVNHGIIRLTRGPLENNVRPAIDPLFRSAARAYGPSVIGILMSGMLDDGVLGLESIGEAGGVTIVQSPEDAAYPALPTNAIGHMDVDHVVPIREMPSLIVELARTNGVEQPRQAEPRKSVAQSAAEDRDRSAILTCPACNGPLTEERGSDVLRYRCRIGHVYSGETLMESQGTKVESAQWGSVLALEERASLFRRMASKAADRGRQFIVERYKKAAEELDAHAAVMREFAEETHIGTAHMVPEAVESS